MSKHMFYLSFCQTEQSSLDVLNSFWIKQTQSVKKMNFIRIRKFWQNLLIFVSINWQKSMYLI